MQGASLVGHAAQILFHVRSSFAVAEFLAQELQNHDLKIQSNL
jgi:hypothetical protein